MRIVLDTNILVSALLAPNGPPGRLLAAAIAGRADLIVSGDKGHVLALGQVEGIPIVTARDALDRLPVTP